MELVTMTGEYACLLRGCLIMHYVIFSHDIVRAFSIYISDMTISYIGYMMLLEKNIYRNTCII